MKRANLIIWAGLATAIILLGLSITVVVRGRSGASHARMARDAARLELERLYAQDPFPTEENVALSRTNLESLKNWQHRLREDLREGQIVATDLSPSVFVERLTETIRTLRTTAPRREGDPMVAGPFLFGFDRYLGAESVMPQPEHVPRLMRQLLMTDRLMQVLYSTEILRVLNVQRETFETASPARREAPRGGRAPAAPTRRGAATPPAATRVEARPSDPTQGAAESFELRIQARANALFQIMNGIARMRPFAVIEGFEMEKTGSDLRASAEAGTALAAVPREGGFVFGQPGAAPAATPAADPALREARLVSGPDLDPPLDIRIRVVFFNFEGD